MKKFYFQVPINQKAIEMKADGTLSIRGMASTKDLDRYNDIVEPKAFEGTLETYMKNPIMLLQHDWEKPIGRFDEATINSDGLEVLGNVLYDEDNCIKKIQDGILGAFSIGYIPKKYEIRDGDGKLLATEAGYEEWVSWEDVWLDSTAVRTIKELDLIEISIVSTPANPNAVFSMQKSIKSFFDGEKKHWKELLEKKTIETQDDPSDDQPEDIDNVANETLKQEEDAGESPATPEAPADETDGTDSEKSDWEPEEKSLVENKEVQDLRKEVKWLTDEVSSYKELATKFVDICNDLHTELESLKSLVWSIPMRKGLVNNEGKSEKKGYISQLLENAQNQ